MRLSGQLFHIFQLKVPGPAKGEPLASFTLTKKSGFHLRLRPDQNTKAKEPYYKMAGLSSVIGLWVQAYVKVQYSTKGSIQIILNDKEKGTNIYTKTFRNNNVWGKLKFRPKWGLYREIDKSAYRKPGDWQLFNNVKIWKK